MRSTAKILFALLLFAGCLAAVYSLWYAKPTIAHRIPLKDSARAAVLVLDTNRVAVAADGRLALYAPRGRRPVWTADLEILQPEPLQSFGKRLTDWNGRLTAHFTKLDRSNAEAVAGYQKELANYRAEHGRYVKATAAAASDNSWTSELASALGRDSDEISSILELFDGERENAPLLFHHGQTIWAASDRGAAGYDVKTGAPLGSHSLPAPAVAVRQGPTTSYVQCEAQDGQHTILVIDHTASPPSLSLRILPAPEERAAGENEQLILHSYRNEYHPTPSGLTQCDVRLAARRISKRTIVKDESAATENVGGGGAAAALEIAETIARDAARERGEHVAYDDMSSYNVTLRRFASPPPPDAKLEVIGRPEFVSAKTVDLILGTQSIHVVSRDNKPLWNAQLSYPIPSRATRSVEDIAPEHLCHEENGTLFVATKGSLSAFDLQNGEVRWRLPLVGIRRIASDDAGSLFVSASDRTYEDLKYEGEERLLDPAKNTVSRVDTTTGQLMWTVSGAPEFVALEDVHLYGFGSPETGIPRGLALRSGGEGKPAFRLCRYRKDGGTPDWLYLSTKIPKEIDLAPGTAALLFHDAVEIIHHGHFSALLPPRFRR